MQRAPQSNVYIYRAFLILVKCWKTPPVAQGRLFLCLGKNDLDNVNLVISAWS